MAGKIVVLIDRAWSEQAAGSPSTSLWTESLPLFYTKALVIQPHEATLQGYAPRADIDVSGADVSEPLARGAERHSAGDLEAAVRHYRTAIVRQPDNPVVLHLLGLAEARLGRCARGLSFMLGARTLDFAVPGLRQNLPNVIALARGAATQRVKAGDLGEAERLYRLLCRADPDHPELMTALADVLIGLGRHKEAEALYREILVTYPTLDNAISGLARARMPGGEDYYTLLGRLHRWLKPRGYLEIGVFQGVSLALAEPTTKAVGVDPAPVLAAMPINGARVLRMTSDDFFERHDLTAELGGQPLDLAFVDGLHTFEQVLLDFLNVEARAHRNTVVVLHDVIPMNAVSAARKGGFTAFWSGDVWKAVVLLRRYRPDLTLVTLPVLPTGACVVTNLDPASRTLRDRYTALVEEGMRMRFDELTSGDEERLAVRDLGWGEVVATIEQAWRR